MAESKNLPPPAIMINLGAEDLEKSIKFYTALGFVQNKNWPYDQIVAFRFPEPNNNIGLVIAHKERLADFLRPGTQVIDAKTSTEVILTLLLKNKEEVDRVTELAAANGGVADPFHEENNGAHFSIYIRSFADPDGHMWEVNADIDGAVAWDGHYPKGRKF
jgi:predicted lactoylglutathione lyase|uniref:Glyoxalase/fosfomycin resistance/dioxygenase domain-containing protein n=1 Tax=Bionectria ochroleuca TaxID=29856 RepID=A0A8H7K5S4_BIOOC